MPFLGSQPAEVALTTGDLGNNIVDGTKTKDALIGDYSDVTITASDLIMYGDATDSNNTKRDTVQGILDLAGGGWSYVSTMTADDSAALGFENMVSGYDYKYMVDYMIMAADNKYFDMRVGVAGPTYRTSGYVGVVRNSAGSVSSSATGEIRIVGASAGIGNAANENLWGAEVILMNPASATYKTTVMARAGFGDNGGTPKTSYSAGNYTTAEANTCAQFFAHVGNITSGTILQYRRSRT